MTGLQLLAVIAVVACATAKSVDSNKHPYGKYDYAEALHKSILFYEAQRSGALPEDRRVTWREDSALTDQGDDGEDLTGGWYDDGASLKWGFPMAATVTKLTWGIIQFRSGYEAAEELDWALDSIRWPLDYFMKAHVADNEFYGHVGDPELDFATWGRVEDIGTRRPAFKITADQPGSDLAGETAAALAAGSIAFADTDPEYSSRLKDHAIRLYDFADQYRGFYTKAIPAAKDYYNSFNYADELCWGAMWLYEATQDESYITKAEKLIPNSINQMFSWEDKTIGCVLLHYKHTKASKSKALIEKYVKEWLPDGKYKYTPKGLVFANRFGPSRHAATASMVALVAADMGIMEAAGRKFASSQIDYLLGDAGRSYMVGFGVKSPLRARHATASCEPIPAACSWKDYAKSGPNGNEVTGALVGGPDDKDFFEDDRQDYIKTFVALDYNACFQGALAGIIAGQAEANSKLH